MAAPAHDEILYRRAEIEAPPDPDRYTVLRRVVTSPEHRLVVAFGGGSVPGLCGNAALARLLEELDLKGSVDEIWGTSAGAVVGGGWASGTPAADILDLVRGLGRGAVDVCWWRLALSAALRPLGASPPPGLVGGRHFRGAIARGLAVRDFEDCPIPFRCIACSDDGRMRRKVFRRGPLAPAIFASMSMPGIIIPPPGGHHDGGLLEKTPLISPIAEHDRGRDGRTLVLLATHYAADATKLAARGFVGRFMQTIYALEDLAWGYQLREARGRDNVVLLLLNPRIEGVRLFDFHRAESGYLQARAAFKTQLDNGSLALAFGRA